MKTISPYEALRENEYVVATKSKPRHIYGLYATEDEARRICHDLNVRYDDAYEVCAIDFGGRGMSGDLEDMRTYSRGYEDGRRSKDADHAAVALRLSRLKFDGGSHENLSKIAQAVYPCATGWTCESSKGLRDRLVDLMGGVHEHRCDNGCDCACGDSRARGVGELAEAMTYDVLGNERHEAVCELQKLDGCSPLAHGFRDALAAAIDVPRDGAPYDDKELCHLICDRLIHLLGGDECSFSVGENYMDAMGEKSNPAETSGTSTGYVILDTPLPEDGTSPNEDETCPNDDQTPSITDELRDYLGENGQEYDNYKGEMIGSISGGLSPIYVIADRIDEQFGHIYHQQGAVLQSAISYLTEECNKLHAECDQLRAKLEDADAAIANWRERERSFEESERERDELRRSLRQIAERAGVPHDRDLSEYSNGQIANAVIGQLGQTNQYVKSLEWVRDRRLPRIEAERVELQAKLDVIREAINDGE